jgi:hypothetical protein
MESRIARIVEIKSVHVHVGMGMCWVYLSLFLIFVHYSLIGGFHIFVPNHVKLHIGKKRSKNKAGCMCESRRFLSLFYPLIRWLPWRSLEGEIFGIPGINVGENIIS